MNTKSKIFFAVIVALVSCMAQTAAAQTNPTTNPVAVENQDSILVPKETTLQALSNEQLESSLNGDLVLVDPAHKYTNGRMRSFSVLSVKVGGLYTPKSENITTNYGVEYLRFDRRLMLGIEGGYGTRNLPEGAVSRGNYNTLFVGGEMGFSLVDTFSFRVIVSLEGFLSYYQTDTEGARGRSAGFGPDLGGSLKLQKKFSSGVTIGADLQVRTLINIENHDNITRHDLSYGGMVFLGYCF